MTKYLTVLKVSQVFLMLQLFLDVAVGSNRSAESDFSKSSLNELGLKLIQLKI